MIAIFPEIAASAEAGDAERLAIVVRRYFGERQTFAPNLPMQELLANAGLEVRSLRLDVLGALLAKDEKGRFSIVVVVNERVDEGSRRFLLAHMLGHYLFDVAPLIARGDWQVSGYREAQCPLKRYVAGGNEAERLTPEARREARADQFAAALLLPRGMVRRAMEKLNDLDKVAAFFQVTKACLVRRLQDMGMLPDAPVNFLDAERQITPPPSESAREGERSSISAPSERAVPRSYAASTYTQTEKSTRKDHSPPTSGEAPKASPRPPKSASGMERLRELARRLDKGS